MAQEDYPAIAASAPANPVPANLAESHARKILEYAFWLVTNLLELSVYIQERAEFRIVRDVHKHLVFLEHSLALLPPAGQLPSDQMVTNVLEFWFLSIFHRLHLPLWRQLLVW